MKDHRRQVYVDNKRKWKQSEEEAEIGTAGSHAFANL